MRRLTHLALFLAVTTAAQQAPAAGPDCDQARRLSALEQAYVLLLRGPGGEKGAKVALYVKLLVPMVSEGAAPELRAALADLRSLTDTLESERGLDALGPEARARHAANARLIGAAGHAADCESPSADETRTADAGSAKDGAPGHSDADGGYEQGGGEGEGGGKGAGVTDMSRKQVFGDPKAKPTFSMDGVSLDSTPMPSFSEIFTLQRLLIAAGLAVVALFVWLVRVLALKMLIKIKNGVKAPAAAVTNALETVARNRRRVPHHVLGRFFDVTLTDGNQCKRIKVADISILGAKLALSDPPKVGTKLHVNLDGVGRDAKVLWVNPHFCGVGFNTALSDAELKMILVRPDEKPETTGELEMF